MLLLGSHNDDLQINLESHEPVPRIGFRSK